MSKNVGFNKHYNYTHFKWNDLIYYFEIAFSFANLGHGPFPYPYGYGGAGYLGYGRGFGPGY